MTRELKKLISRQREFCKRAYKHCIKRDIVPESINFLVASLQRAQFSIVQVSPTLRINSKKFAELSRMIPASFNKLATTRTFFVRGSFSRFSVLLKDSSRRLPTLCRCPMSQACFFISSPNGNCDMFSAILRLPI